MLAAAGALAIVSCTPSEGPESIPLPTSPDTTTTTTSTTTTSTTTTTTTTALPPTYEASITRTTDGVPHITGRHLADLAFGQGYVSGSDYGCTLLDQILKIRGERSANLGTGPNGENLESDFAWRVIDIVGIATADFEAASPEIVEQFEGFVSGWNQQLADANGTLTGWCADAEWIRPIEPVEVYAYARSTTLLASGARLTDFIASAQPPAPPESEPIEGQEPLAGDPDEAESAAEAFTATEDVLRNGADDPLGLAPDDVGSNAWAIGAERVEGGAGGMLVANPHFPWEGELRFAEVHLTVPGEIDIYGAQLAGLPGVGIGFTDGVAWSHTVSAGNRFTAYTLDLVPGSPTTYLVDGEQREMTATEHTVEILRADGTVDTETRTLYSSRYGPILDFPGFGWTETSVLTYRDANIDNDEYVDFYYDMIDVADLDDLIETHRRHQASPLFTTTAVGSDGRTWFGDISATPNLSVEAELLYIRKLLDGDSITTLARDNGVVLLDGSDSRFVWEEVEGARDPGLVPFDEMPMVERTDYVFNANDSYWVPSSEFTLDGIYSILHGEQNVPQSMRTRQNAAVLSSENRSGLSGPDALWNGEELRAAVFDNTAHTAVVLREPVVAACRANPLVEVSEIVDAAGEVTLPAEVVDLTPACDVLAAWDGRYELDRAGPIIWRETMTRFSDEARTDTGPLFADAFSPDRPTTTPNTFADDVTPVLTALARAVQSMAKAGFGLETTLGAAQFTERSETRVPLHGGTGVDGTTNIVQWSDNYSSSEPTPDRGERVVEGGDLRGDGYPVNFGTSFVMTVDYTSGSPVAHAILTYGQTSDRAAPEFGSQMTRFSEKNWRTVLLDPEEIEADPAAMTTVVRQP